MAKTHIMVINWKWSDKLNYPTYIPTDLENFSGDIPIDSSFEPLPVTSEAKTKQKDLSSFLMENSFNKYILPTRVDLSNVLNGNQESQLVLESLRKNYFTQVKSFCKNYLSKQNGFDEKEPLEFIFLFHLGDGLLNKLLGFDETKEVRLGTFGKGTGIMYEENKGLLPLGMATFRFKGDKPVGWFYPEPKYKAALVYEEYFDSVWYYFYFMTHRRLNKFREKILQSQLASASANVFIDIEKLARSLLEQLEYLKNSSSKINKQLTEEQDTASAQNSASLNPESVTNDNPEWDFKACGDLDLWVSSKQLDKYYEGFMKSMKELTENQGKLKDFKDYATLNLAFDELNSPFLS